MELISRAEAKARGLKRYFTGRPCKHGHIAERSFPKSTCLACKAIGSLAAYHADPKKPEKLAARAAYKKRNRAKINAAQRIWRRKNKSHCRNQRREANKRNPERQIAKSAKYYAANAEKRRIATREWTAANPEAAKLARQRWRRENPEKAHAATHNCRAQRAAVDGKHTAAEVKALFQSQRGRCAYCQTSLKDGYHKDHIVPVRDGGSNWIRNIQLTCPKCNLRKNRSDPIEYAKRIGLLI